VTRITRVLSALTALFAGATAPAQVDWIQQSPYPADVSLHGVYFITPDHGFITGADDLFMETADGGTTWTQTPSVARHPQFSEDPIWDVQFVDAQNGFAVGNTVFRTTNGGQTWQNLGSLGTIYDVDFITPQVGYLRGNLFIMKTTNGGASFSMVWDWQTFDPVSGLDFIDENTGLVVGARDDQPGVFRTTNGGETWDRISTEAFSRVRYVTSEIVVASRQAAFYRSTDGGVTWALAYSENTEPVNGMEAIRLIDEDSLAAIDINARIWISHDAGATWTRTFGPLGNWGFEWDIRFPDAETGYAVGRLGLIFKSTDAGQTWTQISNGAAAATNDIAMLPTGVGLAVGQQGVILRTTDFGRKWTLLPQEDVGGIAADINTIEVIDDQTIALAGDTFHYSTDAGATWSQPGPLPGEANDLSFLSADEGWAFGRLTTPWGYIAHTTDAGETWTRVPDGKLFYPAHEGEVMPSGRAWSLFPQTDQAISDDAFLESYVLRSLPSGDSWQEFDFVNDDVGWYGGFFGGILKSTTGGFIFEGQTLPGFRHGSGADTDRLTDICALSTLEAYAAILKQGAIYDGVVYRTTDGGANWVALDPMRSTTNQFGAAITEIDVLPTGEIWALNSSGFIFASGEPSVTVPGDVNGDGIVGFGDLLALLDGWGPCPAPPADCPADVNGDGVIGTADLITLLANWS